MDFKSEAPFDVHSDLAFADKAEYLAAKLKKFSVGKLKKMMNISEDLAQLNVQRYDEWSLPFTEENAKQAIYAFDGDVYRGLEAETMTQKEVDYAQKHLRILSGLYGLIRPLDFIQPYRLEMGTSWSVTPKKASLYAFWKKILTDQIIADLNSSDSNCLLNLASVEYAKAVDFKKLKVDIITPEFKEEKAGKFQMVSFFAKKARGLMASYVIQNRITNPERLKSFDREGYTFNERLSNTGRHKWVFTRKPQST